MYAQAMDTDVSGPLLEGLLAALKVAWPSLSCDGAVDDVGVYVGWCSVSQGTVRDK